MKFWCLVKSDTLIPMNFSNFENSEIFVDILGCRHYRNFLRFRYSFSDILVLGDFSDILVLQ